MTEGQRDAAVAADDMGDIDDELAAFDVCVEERQQFYLGYARKVRSCVVASAHDHDQDHDTGSEQRQAGTQRDVRHPHQHHPHHHPAHYDNVSDDDSEEESSSSGCSSSGSGGGVGDHQRHDRHVSDRMERKRHHGGDDASSSSRSPTSSDAAGTSPSPQGQQQRVGRSAISAAVGRRTNSARPTREDGEDQLAQTPAAAQDESSESTLRRRRKKNKKKERNPSGVAAVRRRPSGASSQEASTGTLISERRDALASSGPSTSSCFFSDGTGSASDSPHLPRRSTAAWGPPNLADPSHTEQEANHQHHQHHHSHRGTEEESHTVNATEKREAVQRECGDGSHAATSASTSHAPQRPVLLEELDAELLEIVKAYYEHRQIFIGGGGDGHTHHRVATKHPQPVQGHLSAAASTSHLSTTPPSGYPPDNSGPHHRSSSSSNAHHVRDGAPTFPAPTGRASAMGGAVAAGLVARGTVSGNVSKADRLYNILSSTPKQRTAVPPVKTPPMPPLDSSTDNNQRHHGDAADDDGDYGEDTERIVSRGPHFGAGEGAGVRTVNVTSAPSEHETAEPSPSSSGNHNDNDNVSNAAAPSPPPPPGNPSNRSLHSGYQGRRKEPPHVTPASSSYIEHDRHETAFPALGLRYRGPSDAPSQRPVPSGWHGSEGVYDAQAGAAAARPAGAATSTSMASIPPDVSLGSLSSRGGTGSAAIATYESTGMPLHHHTTTYSHASVNDHNSAVTARRDSHEERTARSAGGGGGGGSGGSGSGPQHPSHRPHQPHPHHASSADQALAGTFPAPADRSSILGFPSYSATSFVRAYVSSDMSLNTEPAVIVSGLAAALNIVVVYFLRNHVLDTRDHLGLFLIGSYLIFASYYMIYYFLERFSSSFRRISSHDKKFYIIGNLLKAGIFISITPFALYHLTKIIVFDEWEGNILRNLGCIYAIPDFISMIIVKRMRWSTWVHHLLVVVFNYFSVVNDYREENICRCVVVYAAFSSFSYCVNVLLASRFLGVTIAAARVLSFISLVVYVFCCAVNWTWQVYYLRRLILGGNDHWTVYVYMLLICLVMWDDLVLCRWLLNHARSTAFAATQQIHSLRRQQQQQPLTPRARPS